MNRAENDGTSGDDDLLLGLQVVREGINPTVDIIAVHGFGSNPKYTWTKDVKKGDSQKSINWLADDNLLPSKLPNARIMTFNYESKWIFSDLIQRRPLIALQLAAAIHNKRKEALVDANLHAGKYQDVVTSTAGIVFLGTPHRGSDASRWGESITMSMMNLGLGSQVSIMGDLKKNSEVFRDTLYSFAMLVNKLSISLACFFEQHETNTLKGLGMGLSWKGMIVDEVSAVIDGHPKFPLPTDHFGLNKFSGPRDPSYQMIYPVIKEMCEIAPKNIKRRLQSARLSEELEDSQADQKLQTEAPHTLPETHRWEIWLAFMNTFDSYSRYLTASVVANIISRVVTAPFDRIRLAMIANNAPLQPLRPYFGKRDLLTFRLASKEVWKAGKVRSLFVGNGLNCAKLGPESFIKFKSYETINETLSGVGGQGQSAFVTPLASFISGGSAGIISASIVYPVDTIRSRMQSDFPKGGSHGNKLAFQTMIELWRSAGMKGFYRGLPIASGGLFVYSGLNLGIFQLLKERIIAIEAEHQGVPMDQVHPGTLTLGLTGALSGVFGATIIYPFNLLHSRLQIQGTLAHPTRYTGIKDAASKTWKQEGFVGFFKGLTPNLLKVLPALPVTIVTYEKIKSLLGII